MVPGNHLKLKTKWLLFWDILYSNRSVFKNIRRATKDNPVRLATDMMGSDDDPDIYVMEKLMEGDWITVQTQKAAMISRYQGYCNMVYYEVSFEGFF